MRNSVFLSAILLGILTISNVKACPGGLLIIPTTDVVGRDGYSLEYQFDGTARNLKVDTHLINTQFGIGERVEIGVDFDRSAGASPRTFWNAKYVLPFRSTTHAVAVGFQGVAKNQKSSPYLTASSSHAATRLHSGVIGIEGRAELMAGADHVVNNRCTVMADITTGSENAGSVALNYTHNPAISVCAGFFFPNNGGPAGFSVHCVYCGSFRAATDKG